MSTLKKAAAAAAVALFAAILLFSYYYFQTWPLRFHSQLDDFFGKGSWKHVSSETEESLMYTVVYRNTSTTPDELPGKFHSWEILFTNRYGRQELWSISDHTMKINHDKNWLFSPKRYSAGQALTLELMDISFSIAGEEIQREILQKILPEPEALCLETDISYRNGNPPPGVYDKLRKEPWFHAYQITASHYMQTDIYDFYIRIFAHDYKVEKLAPSQQEHLKNSLPEIEAALIHAFGEAADYDIYLGDGVQAERRPGSPAAEAGK